MSEDLTKPEEIFNGDHLPDDLKWLMSHFGLPKDDPTVVLLAWHWKRVQQHNDVIQQSILMLKAALDARIERLQFSAQDIQAMTKILQNLSTVLAEKPLQISSQIEEELQVPITNSVETCSVLAQSLAALLGRVDSVLAITTKRQMTACFVSGLVIGSMLIPWTYSRFF